MKKIERVIKRKHNLEWREFHPAYLKAKQFNFFQFKDFVIPIFVNDQDKNEDTHSFLEIFLNELELCSEDKIVLLFIPVSFELSSINTVALFQVLRKTYPEYHLLLFGNISRDQKSQLSNKYKVSEVSYNTVIEIPEKCEKVTLLYDGILNKKQQNNLKSYNKQFEKSGLTIKKIDWKVEQKIMFNLYNQMCHKFGEPTVEFSLWKEISENSDMVDWFGVYKEEILILFVGFWKSKKSAIISFLGKDLHYEKLIRDSKVYFILFSSINEYAIKNNISKIYNGYGNYDLKKQLGFKKLDYFMILEGI
ncbi:hypothetical protein JZO86_11890 [Enterococcus ureasiticus]|uniref:hypothetical protein n=1 Tax=Enterococcus ureasiticus TaxID=903984 RepID=UPI001A8E391E|nr:hypothetical protein [Enterococcus ureasiticus]MBO0474400.1 hypothetical protein [Enterococcus ureasiticus]